MSESYLEVTFRHGRPLAAYYYLPRRVKRRSFKCRPSEPGIVVDYGRNGQPIGIEITAPTKVTVTAVNRVLRELGFPEIKREDLAPVLAA